MIHSFKQLGKQITLLKSCLLLACILVTGVVSAQCSSDAFMDNCSNALDDFNFIKSFEYSNPKGGAKAEYSYVFSKGSTYRIVVCDENIAGNKMIISLYDRNHKLIASNFDKASKKVFPALTYPCSATGVYYIEYSFQGDKAKCGINILGFTKN